MSFSAPVPLDDDHRLDAFRCTEPWLKQRAGRNQRDSASRCFVVCEGDDVVGYYALAAGAVVHAVAPGNIRRNMPEPIPVVVLGRLAVHQEHSGKGIGSGMLKDAVQRSMRLAKELGIRAMLAHAISEDAKQFYLHHGFVPSQIEPRTLLLNLSKLPA